MLLIHGDNTIQSRKKLVEVLNEYKSKGYDVNVLPAKSLSTSLLEEKLGGESLFGTQQLLVIEELHSLPESAKRKALVAQLSSAQTELVVWEKRLLTKIMISKLSAKQVETFKASSLLFQWLDTLGTSTDKKRIIRELHQIISTESAHFCFTMIVRQIRLLISVLDDGQLKGAPFIISKLRKQARSFSLPQLQNLHSRLLEIDYKQKRSLSALNLEQELDLFVLSI